jgi:uncharacterized membrane protein SirB2
VCCVVVRGSLFLCFAARPIVTGVSLASVTSASVSASVSAWTDYALLFVLLPFALCIFFFSFERSEDSEKQNGCF